VPPQHSGLRSRASPPSRAAPPGRTSDVEPRRPPVPLQHSGATPRRHPAPLRPAETPMQSLVALLCCPSTPEPRLAAFPHRPGTHIALARCHTVPLHCSPGACPRRCYAARRRRRAPSTCCRSTRSARSRTPPDSAMAARSSCSLRTRRRCSATGARPHARRHASSMPSRSSSVFKVHTLGLRAEDVEGRASSKIPVMD